MGDRTETEPWCKAEARHLELTLKAVSGLCASGVGGDGGGQRVGRGCRGMGRGVQAGGKDEVMEFEKAGVGAGWSGGSMSGGRLAGASACWPAAVVDQARAAGAVRVVRAVDPAQEWARAFELWLAGKAENTRRAYGRAWEDLLQFSGKRPWEMLAGDVQAWAEDLARRALDASAFLGLERKGRRSRGGGEGLSASTIAQWLSAVSSFYRDVTTRYVVPSSDGRERPLHDYNPTLTVPRPDVTQYARAEFLDSEELSQLLLAIPRHTVAGLRDYALILGYVLTGRRNTEWRTLRWGDLRGRGAQVYYTWRGKNTDQAKNEVPPPLWEALLAFLEAAGRLEGIRAEDYLFTPLNDNATRLPNVGREGWDGNRALTGEAVNRILRKYARRAGLDAQRVHVHVLRHSAAILEQELGSGLTEISKFLGHPDPKTTMRYLGHLRGRADTTWKLKCAALGVSVRS